MVGHELAVEQGEIADFQARDQPGERDLRGVGRCGRTCFRRRRRGRASLRRARRPARRRRQTSIEWAWPAPCSASIACSSSALIHVSSRSAQAAITAAKSLSQVTEKRPERMVRRSDRETWNPSSGMIARLRGSTQNNRRRCGCRPSGRCRWNSPRAKGADRAGSSSPASLQISRAPRPAGGTGGRLCRSRPAGG